LLLGRISRDQASSVSGNNPVQHNVRHLKELQPISDRTVEEVSFSELGSEVQQLKPELHNVSVVGANLFEKARTKGIAASVEELALFTSSADSVTKRMADQLGL
jgi:hypothetical protein